MHLLLIRHGETALNAARVLQPPDTPLSERGLAQAEALAKRLAQAGLRGLVCSDLPRARQTAERVALATGLALPAADDPLAPLLHERHFGAWRGMAYDALPGNPLSRVDAPPGGESLADFLARTDRAWDALLRRAAVAGGTLAVVTHGLVIAAWLQRQADWAGSGLAPPERLRNASITQVEARPPHRVLRVDDIDHLPPPWRAAPDTLTGG